MPEPSPQRVRIAIIGAGGISSAHATGILAHSDVIECIALCDVSDEYPKTDTFSVQIGDFASRVRSRERPIHSAEEGRQVLEVTSHATADAEGWQELPRFAA